MTACPHAGCRRLSIAVAGGFGCNLSATRNVIRASDARRSAVGGFCRSCASSTPGAVVFGYFRDDLERFGLLFVDLGHFVFIGHIVEGHRQHDVKSLFRRHGVTSQRVQRTREAPFEIIQNDGNRDTCRRKRDRNDIILIPVS
jgi:hypothetical protein